MPASQYSKSFRLDLNAWYEDTRAHLHSEMIQSLIDSFIHSKFGRALISWHEFVYQVSTVSSLSNYLGSREHRPKMGSAWRSVGARLSKSITEIFGWNENVVERIDVLTWMPAPVNVHVPNTNEDSSCSLQITSVGEITFYSHAQCLHLVAKSFFHERKYNLSINARIPTREIFDIRWQALSKGNNFIRSTVWLSPKNMTWPAWV